MGVSLVAKYLDDAGLKYVIKKIKSLLASKQDLLTFDAAPKKESKNPVTSGGIYAALYETDDIFFEIDALGNMMPRDEIPSQITHEHDGNGDLSTVVTYLSSDNYETDSNGDIMPK